MSEGGPRQITPERIGWTGVGWTGTRRITPAARERIDSILSMIHPAVWIITGGCIGVDAYVAEAAYLRGFHVHTIVPADRSRVDPHWLGNCTTYEEMPSGTTYKDRNERIVELTTEHLFAIPEAAADAPESRRSGTWQTVRIGRRERKRVHIHLLTEQAATAPADQEAPM